MGTSTPEYDAPVWREHLPGHPASVRAEQPRDQAGHLIRRALAADEGLSGASRAVLAGEPAFPEFGVGDESGRHYIRRSAIGAELACHVVHPGVQRGLHGAVGATE